MFVRALATTALAGAMVFAPAAAMAAPPYPAPSDSLTCSTAQTAVSTVFTCTVGGPNGAVVELNWTFPGEGTKKLGPVTITNYKAEFTITAPKNAGVLGITAVIDGEAVDTASIEVLAAGDELAATGFENAGLALGAGGLLVAGAATVFVAARRRAAQNA